MFGEQVAFTATVSAHRWGAELAMARSSSVTKEMPSLRGRAGRVRGTATCATQRLGAGTHTSPRRSPAPPSMSSVPTRRPGGDQAATDTESPAARPPRSGGDLHRRGDRRRPRASTADLSPSASTGQWLQTGGADVNGKATLATDLTGLRAAHHRRGPPRQHKYHGSNDGSIEVGVTRGGRGRRALRRWPKARLTLDVRGPRPE